MMFRSLVAAALAIMACTVAPPTVRAAAPAPAVSAVPATSAVPAASAASASSAVPASPVLQQFLKEDDAHKYCPHDEVVYVIPSYKVYFEKDEGLYGTTKQGRYACLKEADLAGYRLSDYGHGLRNR
jgi:hypothetical protein